MRALSLMIGLTLSLAACGGNDDSSDTNGSGGEMDMSVLENVAVASAFVNIPSLLLGMDSHIVDGAMGKKPPPCPVTVVEKEGNTTTVTATGGCSAAEGQGTFTGTMVMTRIDPGKGERSASFVHTGWGVTSDTRTTVYDGTLDTDDSQMSRTVVTSDLRFQDSAPAEDFNIDQTDLSFPEYTSAVDNGTKNESHITTSGTFEEATLGAVDFDGDVIDIHEGGCAFEPDSGSMTFSANGDAVLNYDGTECDHCVDVTLADGSTDQLCADVKKGD
jgi:hypothetical protein